MSDEPLPQSEFILYQTEDGRTRVQCRFDSETLWLTQALIAELFEKDVRTINEHLVNIFDEGELRRDATIRKFRITARASSGMAGFSRRMASRKRPTSTTSPNESRSAAGSPGASCGPCPTA